MKIILPINLKSIQTIDGFNNSVYMYLGEKRKKITIEFRTLNFISPLGAISLLLAIEKLNEIYKENLNINTNDINSNILSYLERINFFKFIPSDVKKIFKVTTDLELLENRNRNDTRKNLLEITPIKSLEDLNFICDRIFDICSHLPNNKICINIINIITELADNVITHSEGEGYVTVQYYPSNKIIKIAIADNGVGIVQKFKSHGHVGDNELEILKEAFKEGSSTDSTTKRGLGLQTMLDNSFKSEYMKTTKLLLKTGSNIYNLSNGEITIQQRGYNTPGTYYEFIISI